MRAKRSRPSTHQGGSTSFGPLNIYAPPSVGDDSRVHVVELITDEHGSADANPAIVAEGLRRRFLVNDGGTCPCGARLVLPNRAARRAAVRAGEPLSVKVAHESDCEAVAPDITGRGWAS